MDNVVAILFYISFGAFLTLTTLLQQRRFNISIWLFLSLASVLVLKFSVQNIILLAAVALMFFLEYRYPRNPVRTTLREADRLVLYFFLKRAAVIVPFLLLGHESGNAGWLQLAERGCPLWLQWFIALLVLDSKQYWIHRAQHKVALWWRFHRVHHLSPDLTMMAQGRVHILEFAFVHVISNILVAQFLGLEAKAVIYGYLFPALVIGGFWSHLNFDCPRHSMPWWAYVIATPNFHALHHTQANDRVNYGEILVIWDIIFGTFASPVKHRSEIKNFGVAGKLPASHLWQEQFSKL